MLTLMTTIILLTPSLWPPLYPTPATTVPLFPCELDSGSAVPWPRFATVTFDLTCGELRLSVVEDGELCGGR